MRALASDWITIVVAVLGASFTSAMSFQDSIDFQVVEVEEANILESRVDLIKSTYSSFKE